MYLLFYGVNGVNLTLVVILWGNFLYLLFYGVNLTLVAILWGNFLYLLFYGVNLTLTTVSCRLFRKRLQLYEENL